MCMGRQSMRTALLVPVLLAVSVALPISVSAKQPRSASAKREFQLTHPVQRRDAQAAHAPVTSRITWPRLRAEGLTHPRTCNGKQGLMRRPRISGKQKAARGRCDLSHSGPSRHELAVPSIGNRSADRANPGLRCPRHIGSHLGVGQTISRPWAAAAAPSVIGGPR
jgi:hypothetical protein